MRTGPARCILSFVTLVVLIASALTAGAQPQEMPKPEIRREAPAPSESAAPGKKHMNVYEPLEMQAFSVALLLGEVTGGGTPDNLPPGATKALADVREFLPYKHYRLLDTQWIRCCAGPTVTGRLRGLDEQHYTFEIIIKSVSGHRMTSAFALANHDASIISSNFAMETGETVVIGTSGLKGNRALVVLLTAVPRPNAITQAKKGSGK